MFFRSALSLLILVGTVGLSLSMGLASPVVAAPSAQADGSGMVTIPIPTTAGGLTINLVTGETSTTGDQPDGWDVQITDRLIFNANTRRPAREAGFVSRLDQSVGGTYNLPLGFEVNDSLPFVDAQQPTDDATSPYKWLFPGGANYVGVKFWNEVTGAYHYGWMRFCVSENLTVEPRALVEYGYEATPGAPIQVGGGGVGDPSDCGASGLTELTRPFCSLAQDIRSDTISYLRLEATPSCSNLGFLLTPDGDGILNFVRDGQAPWENTTMQGPAGKPVNVTLSGLNQSTGGPAFFELVVRTLTLKDANLDPSGFLFTFNSTPAQDPMGFTLENASVVWGDSPSWRWTADAALDFRASSGENTLLGMNALVPAATKLKVENGATLKFRQSGSLVPGRPDDSRLYFSNNTNEGDIDGGTLEIRDSYVVWGTDNSQMLVRNGGQLFVIGGGSVLRSNGDLKAETGGSIKLGAGGVVVDAKIVDLNNGSIDVGGGAQLWARDINVPGGNNIVTLNNGNSSTDVRVSEAVIVQGDGSTLTLAGSGTLSTPQLLMTDSGSLVRLTERSVLAIAESPFKDWKSGSIEIGPLATLSIRSGANVASEIPIDADGFIRVGGTFRPLSPISGAGELQVLALGQLQITGRNPVSVDPEIQLDSLSTLVMRIYPAEGKSAQLIANSAFSIPRGGGAYLELIRTDDAVLAPGTQFEVVKYPDGNALGGLFRRADNSLLRDGDEIIAGLNTYRINYNPTSITLTVVAPERVKANDDYYTALQDQTLTVPAPGVLDNDVNVTGNPVVVTPPMHGTVTLNPDGSFTYIPDPGFFGDDSFTYQVGTSNVATVYIHVRAQADCTLTAGYWQTHAGTGGAALDTTWLELPFGPATPFFQSGQTYLDVLAAETMGNPYYILAQQYVAAELNFLRGANPTEAQAAFDAATALFNATTPDQAAALESQARQEWINLASILDDYNNGYIGPGHCSE
jgi:hypothetical protein